MSSWIGKVTVVPVVGETEVFEHTGGVSVNDGVLKFRVTDVDGNPVDHGFSVVNILRYWVVWDKGSPYEDPSPGVGPRTQ